MNNQTQATTAFKSLCWPKENIFLKQALLVLLGVSILSIVSQLSIPFKPVPLTFQSATVVLIGMAYGSRLGASVILSYFAAGCMGLPVFADYSMGIQHFGGFSGGYLLGFLPAAYLSGLFAERGWAKNRISAFAVALFSASVIFLFGVVQLAHFIGWENAITWGLMPFIYSEFIKLFAVSLIVPNLWKKSAR